MKSKTLAAILCSLSVCLIFSSCALSKRENSQTENSSFTSGAAAQGETSLNGRLSELKTPDTIVYYFNGHKKVFTSNDPKFQKIIQINSARNTVHLDMLKSAMKLDNISKAKNMLV